MTATRSDPVDVELWRVRREGRELVAIDRFVEGVGFELRMLLNGALLWSRAYRLDHPVLLAAASAERVEKISDGWREN